MDTVYQFHTEMKKAVAEYLNKSYKEHRFEDRIEWTDVFVIWSCKTLQNIKAILAAPGPNHMIFEATYNGDKHETYLDCYDKVSNITIKVEE